MKSKPKSHTYTWTGITHQNKIIQGETQAFSENFVKIQLAKQNITLKTIQKKKIQLSNFFKKSISQQDIVVFFRQLSTLITAGVPLLQSCESLRQSQQSRTLQHAIDTIKKEIEAGNSFSQSVKKFPQHFNDFCIFLLEAGEASGRLDIMLMRIAHYQEKLLKLKKRIQQALFYPGIILSLASIVTLIMMIFVVPRFEELFNNMHSPLPAFTRCIISLSHFIRAYGALSFLFIASFFLFFYLKRTPTFSAKWTQRTLLFLPGIRSIFQKIILARLTRCMATLLSAGIPIIQVLKISTHVSGHPFYIQALQQSQLDIAAGKQLHMALNNPVLFPPLLIHMIKIGEESGSLDPMLEKVAELYEADIDHFVANLNHLIEPLIMTMLGALIGGLVIAMYLPIFKLGTVI